MKSIGPFLTALFLIPVIALHAADSPSVQLPKPPENLTVHIGPCFVPDSGVARLFADRLSRIDFLFYRKGDEPIKEFDKNVFTVELPKSAKLNSVALMSGWKKSGGKYYEFPAESVTRDGREYVRYTLPLPAYPGMTKAEPVVGGMFGGISYNHAKLFLRFGADAPKEFDVYWKVAGGTAHAEGRFPVRLFPAPSPGSPKPKRIFFPSPSAVCTPLYADLGEIRATAEILRDTGITHVNIANRAALLEKKLPDVWSEAGFGFLNTQFEFMDTSRERNSLPEIRDYLVGLDKERAKGSHADKFHWRIYCPQSLATPGRTGFQRTLEKTLQQFAAGADWVDFDLEPPVWTRCFCDDCLREFAAFSGKPFDRVSKMKPLDIITTWPETWYRFQSAQTAKFYKNLREAVREHYPKAKISANCLLVDLEKKLGTLGRGVTHFAEHPGIVDASVDLHTIDALTGSVHDPISVDVERQMTAKPIIGTAGSSYCVAYNHACIVGRRVQAGQRGLPLGYDQRGDFQRLGMVHSAASGAQGIRVAVLEENETIDAEVALKTADGAAVLAKVEDVYLDGERRDEDIEVIDLTEGRSPYEDDRSLIRGGIWKHFYKIYGAVQYRVHRLNGETVVSLFNWDPLQPKQWLVRFKQAPEKGAGAANKLTGRQYVLEGGKPRWSREELQKGILATVPPAGFAILSFGAPAEGAAQEAISQTARDTWLAKVLGRSPANQNAWQTDGEFNLREAALKGIQRGSQYLLPGTIPEQFLKKQ